MECQSQIEAKDKIIKEKDDSIRQLEIDIASKKQSQEALKMLRDELNKTKISLSQQELAGQNKDHQIQDLQNKINLAKKKEEMGLERIRKLELEIEELRELEGSRTSVTGGEKDDFQS